MIFMLRLQKFKPPIIVSTHHSILFASRNLNGRPVCHPLIPMCLYATISLLLWSRCVTSLLRYYWPRKRIQMAESTERLPSAHRCCYYTVDCATTRAHSILQFSVSFVKASFSHGRGANDHLWQKNGLTVFDPSLYSTATDFSIFTP